MVRFREEYRQTQTQTKTETDIGDDDHYLDDIQIINKLCDQVLGTRSWYIRRLENGHKPLKSTSSDASSSRPTNAQLKEQLESTQNELRSTRNELQAMKVDYYTMIQAFERITPGLLQSLVQ
ncbi:hypothetical protein Pfo_026813 [Paulownia fortunei]|nr:hypothetical protein Pfo_026813 [Paulownia fortunei]